MNAFDDDGSRVVDGWSWLATANDTPRSLWGRGEQVLWASGESIFIAAAPGVGKTTLAQRLTLAMIGIGAPVVLGFAVRTAPCRVMYVAADRPRQALHSLQRMVGPENREKLEIGLRVVDGPLPFLLSDPGADFAGFVDSHDCGVVVIDSLSNVAVDLAKDEGGAVVNQQLNAAVAAGIEVAVLHHDRKIGAEAGRRRLRGVDDMYGSRWLGAGAGSVIFLEGSPGDPLIRLRHLKTPAAEAGPIDINIDHRTGNMHRIETADPLALLRSAGSRGLTAPALAREMYGESPSKADREKARRRLRSLESGGLATSEGGGSPSSPRRWRIADTTA